MAILLASLVAVLGLLTLRTWMVTGAFVLAPSSGGVALLVGNEPPRPLDAAPPGRTAVYNTLRLEAPTRTVVEYAFQLPGEFLGNLARKAVYTVGLFERSGIDAVGVGVPDASWLYVALWCSALVGAVRILRAPGGLPWPTVLLPALLALSHFAAVVLILPYWYGDRLILPLYPLLVPYAAFGLEPLVHWALNRTEHLAAAMLVALALCVFVTGSPRMSDVVILLVFGALVLAIATGPRPRFTRQAWLYWGYTAALLVAYLETRRSGHGGDVELAAAFLLPLAAFAVARLARARVPYVATLGAVAVGAIVAVVLLRPPMPGDEDIIDLPGDITRDLRSVIAGNTQARQELADDAREMLSVVFRPIFATFRAITTQTGAVAGFFLFGMWLQALLVSGHAAVRGRSAMAGICFAALLTTCVMAVLGIAPSRWGASAYSVAVLGVLFGLAESRRNTRAAS